MTYDRLSRYPGNQTIERLIRDGLLGLKFTIRPDSRQMPANRRKRARQPSKTGRVAKLILFAACTVVATVYAFHLFQSSESSQQPRGSDLTPQVMFMISERQVALQLEINYYTSYYPSAEELGFGNLSGSLPTGNREIQMQFIGGRPGSELQYTVLLGQGAAESDPIAQQNEMLATGSPGSMISANCTSPQTMGVTQVLYGRVRLDSQGDGSVDTIGRLSNQHAYLSDGTANVVGLLDIVPAVTDMESPADFTQGCVFPDWPYLGGVLWYSPAELSGEVTVGPVGGNYSVDSAIPTLSNLSSLSWTINGPTAINYTLTDTALASHEAREAFWAGVLAALAAGFAVEVVNSAVEVFESRNAGESAATPALLGTRDSVREGNARPILIAFLVNLFILRFIIRLFRRLARLRQ